MAEEKKTVFEQLQDSLAIIIDELSEANNALYVTATTVMDLSDKLDTLNAKLDAVLGAATKVTSSPKETPVIPKPVPSTFKFAQLKKETK